MKFIPLCLLIFSVGASAQNYVQPHFRSNGTLVEGHYKNSTAPGAYRGTGPNTNSTYVQPHMTQEGTFIQGHHRTTPDNTTLNNYGTSGNFNPYTGTVGTRSASSRYGC